MCGPASFRREEPLPSTQNIFRELAIPYAWMQSLSREGREEGDEWGDDFARIAMTGWTFFLRGSPERLPLEWEI